MGNLNQTESKDQFAEIFRDFCETYYPPSSDYQNPCSWFVNGIFFVMDRTDPVYHCDQIGACGKPTNLVQINRRPVDTQLMSSGAKDSFCGVCEQLVNEAKAVLDSPMAIDTTKKQLEFFCDYLAVVGLSKECKQQVGKYIDQAVEFVHEIDPLGYCQSIQLCEYKKPTYTLDKNNLEYIDLLMSTPRELIKDSQMLAQYDEIRSKESKPLRGPNCILCKTIVKELFHFLKENKTEENIRYGLDQICKLIYTDKDKLSECDDMVDGYARELIEFLAAESDPNLICILIDQCTYNKNVQRLPEAITKQQAGSSLDVSTQDSNMEVSSRKSQVTNLAEFMTSLDPTIGSFETCLECKVFIRYLRDQIDKPLTEAKIKELILTKLCNNLGDKELQGSCKNLVDSYADIFFKAVVMELNPESACVAMAACRNKTLEPLEAIVNTDKQTLGSPIFQLGPVVGESTLDQCSFCVKLVDEFDEFVSTHPDESESISKQVLCDKFEDQARCGKIFEESSEAILRHVADMKGSMEVCQERGYC